MVENESLDLNSPRARRWNTVRDAALMARNRDEWMAVAEGRTGFSIINIAS